MFWPRPLVLNEIFQHVLDGLPFILLQTFMAPGGGHVKNDFLCSIVFKLNQDV